MTQTQVRASRARRLLIVATGIVVAVALVRFSEDAGTRAWAAGLTMYEADHGRFPRHKSKYQSDAETTYEGGIADPETKLKSIGLLSRTAGPLLPTLGESAQIQTPVDVGVAMEVDGIGSGGIQNLPPVLARFIVTGDDGGGGGGGGGSWPIELAGLDLAINDATLGKALLRESPTLASTGLYSLTPLGGGLTGFTVDSFFDVFSEVSLDSGSSWRPAETAVRMTLVSFVPEPGTVALGAMAAGCAALLRRRRS